VRGNTVAVGMRGEGQQSRRARGDATGRKGESGRRSSRFEELVLKPTLIERVSLSVLDNHEDIRPVRIGRRDSQSQVSTDRELRNSGRRDSPSNTERFVSFSESLRQSLDGRVCRKVRGLQMR